MQMLSRLVRDKLEKDAISIRESGRQIGVSATTISRILNDESIDVDTLIAVCAWLEVSPSNVLDAELNDDRALGSRLATVIQSAPELTSIFVEMLNRLEDNTIDMNVARDLVAYATWRLKTFTDGKEFYDREERCKTS